METKTEQPAKTAEEILLTKPKRSFGWYTYEVATIAMKEYAAQFYTRTEVSELMKRLLHDASYAAKATPEYHRGRYTGEAEIDKESITNIDVETYLTK